MAIKNIIKLLFPLFILTSCGGNKIEENKDRVMHNYSVYNDGVQFDASLWNNPTYKTKNQKIKMNL